MARLGRGFPRPTAPGIKGPLYRSCGDPHSGKFLTAGVLTCRHLIPSFSLGTRRRDSSNLTGRTKQGGRKRWCFHSSSSSLCDR